MVATVGQLHSDRMTADTNSTQYGRHDSGRRYRRDSGTHKHNGI